MRFLDPKIVLTDMIFKVKSFLAYGIPSMEDVPKHHTSMSRPLGCAL